MFFAIDQHRMSQHNLQHGGVMGGVQHGNGMSSSHFIPPLQQGMQGQHQQQQQQQYQHVPGVQGGLQGVSNSVPGVMPSGGGNFVAPGQPGLEAQQQQVPGLQGGWGQQGMQGQYQQQQYQQHVPVLQGGWQGVPNSVPGGMPSDGGMRQGAYPTKGTIFLAQMQLTRSLATPLFLPLPRNPNP